MNKDKVKEEIKKIVARLEKLKAEVNVQDELEPYEWGEGPTYIIDYKGSVCDLIAFLTRLFQFPYTPKGKKQAEDYAKQLRLNSMILRLKQSLGDEGEFNHKTQNYCVARKLGSFTISRGRFFHYAGMIYFSSKENAQKVCDWLNENWDYEKGQRK